MCSVPINLCKHRKTVREIKELWRSSDTHLRILSCVTDDTWNRNTAIDVVTTLHSGRSGARILAEATASSLLQNVQICFETHSEWGINGDPRNCQPPQHYTASHISSASALNSHRIRSNTITTTNHGEMLAGLHVKCLLFLYHFKQNKDLSKNLSLNPTYKIFQNKSGGCCAVPCTRMDWRTDTWQGLTVAFCKLLAKRAEKQYPLVQNHKHAWCHGKCC